MCCYVPYNITDKPEDFIWGEEEETFTEWVMWKFDNLLNDQLEMILPCFIKQTRYLSDD